MARGTEAKNFVVAKLAETFGNDWIGEVDKKYYVWAKENGERLQIAISLTCPKNLVEAVSTPNFSNALNFEEDSQRFILPPSNEITEEEKENLRLLMEKLNL